MQYVTLTHTYLVADDIPLDVLDSIAAACFVQIDENVVSLDDAGNEFSIEVDTVTADLSVQPATWEQIVPMLQRAIDLKGKGIDFLQPNERTEILAAFRAYGADGNGTVAALAQYFPDLLIEAQSTNTPEA